jgi:hypothetical protein
MEERVQAGDGTQAVQVRFQDGLFAAIEDWRRQQAVIPSRPQAIRELIQSALSGRVGVGQRSES